MTKQKEIIINNKINDILKKHFSGNVSLLKMSKVEELYSEGNKLLKHKIIIKDKNIKFGANCYGYRPKITQEEAEAMRLAPLYPRTRRERAFDKRVDYWRNQLSEIQVAPFNHNNWSII